MTPIEVIDRLAVLLRLDVELLRKFLVGLHIVSVAQALATVHLYLQVCELRANRSLGAVDVGSWFGVERFADARAIKAMRLRVEALQDAYGREPDEIIVNGVVYRRLR